MGALTIAAEGGKPDIAKPLQVALRYDLSQLRAKKLVEKVPHSRRYRLLSCGYSVCLVFLKLFERV